MSSPNQGVKLFAKRMEVRLLRQSRPDLFIFESRAMRDLAVTGRGIPLSQTAVVPTGTDVNEFRPMPTLSNTVYRRFDIPSDRRIVVFMGHFHERKGVHILLQAADQIVTRHHRSDLHFLFLGTTDNDVTQLSHHFGASVTQGYVTFAGYHADVPALLAGCYLGCVPSSGWDSFPMSSLEMQACALPMIVSSLQGVPETIDEGVTGVTFPSGDASALADALLRLGDNAEQRESMAHKARERIVQNFAVSHYVNRLEKAIRAVLEA
jgi:glycosyltransferase involved in cell wall biosynthesis